MSIEIPQNVIEAGRRAAEATGITGQTMGVIRSLRSEDQGRYIEGIDEQLRSILTACLAEWDAEIDDDDGHNHMYRIITGWRVKP